MAGEPKQAPNRPGPTLPRWFAATVYVGAAVITVLMLVVYTTKAWDWRVDEITFALLIFLVLIPIAERLRKLKAFGVEAGFGDLEGTVENLERLVIDQADKAGAPPEEADATATEEVARKEGAGPAWSEFRRMIDRIVWVDDEPAGNRIEIADLERRFAITIATTTQAGLDALGRGEDAALITDAVRIENGETNLNAGLEMIEAAKQLNPAIQVYVYCGQDTAEKYAEPLESAGARIVTASFVELSRMFRIDARASFESEVAAVLKSAGSLTRHDTVDFIVELGGKRVGVEAKDYRRTPKKDPLDRAMALLEGAISENEIDLGYVVSPRNVFSPTQHARAPEGVELIAVEDLAPRLLAIGAGD